jgi:hypothetical protein
MSLRNSPLFFPNGLGTPLLFGQLRRRMPQTPLQSRAVLVDGGVASRYFADWWRASFPDRRPLPKEPIANKNGTGTERLWDVLA